MDFSTSKLAPAEHFVFVFLGEDSHAFIWVIFQGNFDHKMFLCEHMDVQRKEANQRKAENECDRCSERLEGKIERENTNFTSCSLYF